MPLQTDGSPVTFLHLYRGSWPLGGTVSGAISRTDQSEVAMAGARENRGIKHTISQENSHSAVKV